MIKTLGRAATPELICEAVAKAFGGTPLPFVRRVILDYIGPQGTFDDFNAQMRTLATKPVQTPWDKAGNIVLFLGQEATVREVVDEITRVARKPPPPSSCAPSPAISAGVGPPSSLSWTPSQRRMTTRAMT